MRTHISAGQLLNVQYKNKTVAFYAKAILPVHAAAQQLMWVFNNPSIWRPGFVPSMIHVESARDKTAPRQTFLQAHQFSHGYNSTDAEAWV